jgi:hypothetical protein
MIIERRDQYSLAVGAEWVSGSATMVIGNISIVARTAIDLYMAIIVKIGHLDLGVYCKDKKG